MEIVVLGLFMICAVGIIFYFFILHQIQGLQKIIDRLQENDITFDCSIEKNNRFKGMKGIIEEMADKVLQYKNELEHVAYFDYLTEMPNYRAFLRDYRVLFEKNRDEPFTLILLELADLGYYNEVVGYDAGDEALKLFFKTIEKHFDGIGSTYRLDGCKAGILVSGKKVNIGEGIRELQQMWNAVEIEGREFMPEGSLECAAGTAVYPEQARTADVLMDIAEDNLYKAVHFLQERLGQYYGAFAPLKNEDSMSFHDQNIMIKTLLSILQCIDSYTRTHSENVSKYATIMAQKMGLPEEDLITLRLGGLLHDIGKIEVGREILNKQGKLAEDEWLAIRMHPIYGANMIRSIEEFQPLVPMLKYHHERYDGKGYPEGLKKEEIPVFAQIISLADSFDAMTSKRSYRGFIKSFDEALEEITRCAGTQFDPKLARIFVEAIEEYREEMETAV